MGSGSSKVANTATKAARKYPNSPARPVPLRANTPARQHPDSTVESTKHPTTGTSEAHNEGRQNVLISRDEDTYFTLGEY